MHPLSPALATPWLLAALLGAGLTACVTDDEPHLGVSEEASQCGAAWDVQNVENYDGTLGVSTAFVARHQARVGFHVGVGCSGTLISDDLFLSAGHCNYAVGHSVRFNYQNAPDGSARPTRDFTVSAVVEQENANGWDYAIVRLNGSPGRTYGHANIAAIDAPVGSNVTIIQHPASVPKVVHAGPVLDYVSGNWFRHQVDTTGGTSGSGILDNNGELVGVHTSAGCSTTAPINGNFGMRMSQLVPHSPTLQVLSRSKLLWWNPGALRTSLWSVNADGSQRDYREHSVGSGWAPVSMSNNHILWRHTSDQMSYWTLDDAGNYVTSAAHGPFAGWTAISHANDRILWTHTSGEASLWTVNATGGYLSSIAYAPMAGWRAVAYANNKLLWRHTDGGLSIWYLDDAGNQQRGAAYAMSPAWTLISFSNNEILWRYTDGRVTQWNLNPLSDTINTIDNGPYGGWTVAAGADRKLMWRHTDGRVSYWTTNSDGAFMRYIEHGPFGGWTGLLTSGGTP